MSEGLIGTITNMMGGRNAQDVQSATMVKNMSQMEDVRTPQPAVTNIKNHEILSRTTTERTHKWVESSASDAVTLGQPVKVQPGGTVAVG